MKKTIYLSSSGELKRQQNTLFFQTEKGRKYIPVQETQEITERNFDIILYPNPTNQWVNILLNNDEETKVRIFDINGREAGKKSLSGCGSHRINIDFLEQGIYFFEITDGLQIITEKVIVL